MPEMQDKFCPCGKKLVLKYKRDFSRKRFCSKACRIENFPPKKIVVPDVYCKCGKKIEDRGVVKTIKRAFCSRQCAGDSRVGSKRTWGAGIRGCVKCGSVYEATSTKQKWCTTCCPTLTARRRLQRYNLSQPEFDALLLKQGGRCPICKNVDKEMVVDHDHSCCSESDTCGKCIRGLLCHVCNRFVGMIEATNHLFADAMTYLQGGE